MENKKAKGTEFIVELEGIELPKELHAEINAKIQNAVMESLAKLDLRKQTANLTSKEAFAHGLGA